MSISDVKEEESLILFVNEKFAIFQKDFYRQIIFNKTMYQNYNYNQILHESIEEDLIWFELEFDFMFKNKTDKYNNQELDFGNQILNKMTETIDLLHDEKLLNSFTDILTNIERKYPVFF